MIGEINIAGIFISPLLLCMVLAFGLRWLLSFGLERLGLYRWVAQRRLADTAAFLLLTGVLMSALHGLTAG